MLWAALLGPPDKKLETLIRLPCHELTADLSSSGATWQEDREMMEAGETHPTFLEPQLLWWEKGHPPSVHWATVPPQDSRASGENAKIKRWYTHTLSPRIPLLYSLCPKMESHLEALFICTWCAGLTFGWPWGPASLYLMKNKWKLTACFIGALKSGLLPQSACCYF